MKTITQFAKESRQFDDGLFPNWSDANIWDEGVKSGVQFAETWIPVEEELPEEDKFGMSVFVLTLAGSMFGVKRYDHVCNCWSGSNNITVSHWRPINRK